MALAVAGARLEIALCLEDSARVPFDPARRTLAQLRGALDRAGIVEEPTVRFDAPSAETGRFRVVQLRRLERGLYAEAPAVAGERAQPAAASEASTAAEAPAPAVVLQAARTPRLEVLLWARTLDRWLRLDPQPCAPQETAVILRDLDAYRDFIREIFPLYGLPVFLDERRGLLAHPRVRFLLEALEVILSGWRRDAVLTFLRNPLLAVPPAELDLLEILSREYGRDFESWHAPAWEAYDPGRRARFRRSDDERSTPEGEGEEAEESEGEGEIEEVEELPPDAQNEDEDGRRRRESLLRTDRLRTRWLLPLRALEERWRGAPPTGPDLVAGLRALARDLPPAAEAREPDPEPEWTVQVEGEVEVLLDEAASLWEGVAVEPEEFARALRQGCASARVGVTPQRLGQVTVAEVQRSRLHGIRRAIVGGATTASSRAPWGRTPSSATATAARSARSGWSSGPPPARSRRRRPTSPTSRSRVPPSGCSSPGRAPASRARRASLRFSSRRCGARSPTPRRRRRRPNRSRWPHPRCRRGPNWAAVSSSTSRRRRSSRSPSRPGTHRGRRSSPAGRRRTLSSRSCTTGSSAPPRRGRTPPRPGQASSREARSARQVRSASRGTDSSAPAPRSSTGPRRASRTTSWSASSRTRRSAPASAACSSSRAAPIRPSRGACSSSNPSRRPR